MRKNFLFSIIFLFTLFSSGCSPKIQKRFDVTEYVSGPYIKTYGEQASKKCQKISISKLELDEMLKKGVKVISTSKFISPVKYKGTFPYTGECVGTTYILEGPKKILNKYERLVSIPEE